MTVGVGAYNCQISVRKSELPTGIREEMVGRSRNFSVNLQPTHIVILTRGADPPTHHCSSHLESSKKFALRSPRRYLQLFSAVVKDAEDGSLTDV